jgi:hypothetical protein
MMTPLTLARIHGMANIVGGVWPLVHMKSFERVLGTKVDRWLVQTVAGLLVTIGCVQARSTERSVQQSRNLGIGTAATLLAIDLRYAIPRRISRVYLLDAALEAGALAMWLTVGRRSNGDPGASASDVYPHGPGADRDEHVAHPKVS